jgi:hypothetical protein
LPELVKNRTKKPTDFGSKTTAPADVVLSAFSHALHKQQGILRTMLQTQKHAPKSQPRERRKTRRHIVNLPAKAGLKRDNPTPCVVRNISALGALLQFESPTRFPKHFRVAIDNPAFTAGCELRHATETTAGVMFISNREEASAFFG